MSTTIPRSIVLLICAAGHGDLVCGRPPGHSGIHWDVQWPAGWHEPEDAAVTPAPHPGSPVPGAASPPPIPAQRTGR